MYGGQQSTSQPTCFTPVSIKYEVGFVSQLVSTFWTREIKGPFPCQKSNPDPPANRLVTILSHPTDQTWRSEFKELIICTLQWSRIQLRDRPNLLVAASVPVPHCSIF